MFGIPQTASTEITKPNPHLKPLQPLDDTQYINNKSVITPQRSQTNHKGIGVQGIPLSTQTNWLNHTFKSPVSSDTAGGSMFNRHDKRAKSIALHAPLDSNSKTQKLYKVKGGSPGGVYLYDSSRRSQIDDEESANVVDFIKRNLNIGKDQKNLDFERSKDLITKIYERIKKRKDYGLDRGTSKSLSNIQACLNPRLKQHFIGNQAYFQIFSEANILNQTFMQIIDQVCCYRLELGIVLQKMVESYNSIILQQFEEFYRSENEKEKELGNKLIAQQQATEELIQRKLEFEKRIDAVQSLISGKDIQISSLMIEKESLEKEVKYLRELIDLDSSKKSLGSSSLEVNLLNVRDDKAKAMINIERKNSSQIQKQMYLRIQKMNRMKRKIFQMEWMSFLKQCSKVILQTNKYLATRQSVGTQVEDGELFWKPQHYANESGKSSRKLLAENKQYTGSKQAIQQPHKENELQTIQEQVVTEKLNYVSPMEDYGSTQKILQLKEEEKLIELEQKLNQLVNNIKKEDSKDQEGAEISMWSIPSHILIFIANSLEEEQTGRVLPWPEFKQIIYDMYDYRIQYASEVNGVINTTYLNFEEYILIYFLDKYKLRRLAEVKLIETLTSLKYYLEIWPRAKNFAMLLNIFKPSRLQTQFTQRKASTQQSNAMMELSIPNVDIYLQEFFLHAYSILVQDKDHFLESKDGVTYMKINHEETASGLLMTWFGDQDARKWFHKVRRNVKKIKTSPLDDFETDYIDIDVLLNMYIEEFKNKKKINQKNLSKEFLRRYQEQEGLFNTEEIDKIIQACVPISSPSAFVKYPSLVSIRRAFLYALVCGENGFEINTQEFIAGCNRFGLDNPCPTVTKRLSLYGNDEDLDELLKKEMIKQNIMIQTKMHTSKLVKGGIKIESARLSTSQMRNENSQLPQSNNSSRMKGIQNLKLLGRGNTTDLESSSNQNIIAGGVRINIATLNNDIGGNSINGITKRTGLMSQEEQSINNKKIIIPSFSTTSALFSQHFSILRDLKKRIEGLKQAYYNQREEERSWEQVEKILHVLEAACKFLDFPIQN